MDDDGAGAVRPPDAEVAPDDLRDLVQQLLVDAFLDDRLTVPEYRLLMDVYR